MVPPAAARLIDPAGPGTAEHHWRTAIDAQRLPAPEPGWSRSPHRAVVVAPHPDDEVLGAGGLIRRLLRWGWRVEVLAVTDGEAAFGPPDAALAARRTQEVEDALDRLADGVGGAVRPTRRRLALPDGGVATRRDQLEAALEDRLVGAALCVAPWAGDGHPDHEAAGRACEAVAARVRPAVGLLRYPVWLWHWGDPAVDLPWPDCVGLRLDADDLAAKAAALGAFASQLPGAAGDGAILTPSVLAHFRRDIEVFVASAHR